MRPALIGGSRGPLDCCWAGFSGSLTSTLLSNRVRMCRHSSWLNTDVSCLRWGRGVFPRPDPRVPSSPWSSRTPRSLQSELRPHAARSGWSLASPWSLQCGH